jgi:hypothetical protein
VYPPAEVRLALCEAVLRPSSEHGVGGHSVDGPHLAARRVARALVSGPYHVFQGPLDDVIAPADQGGSQASELLDGWIPTTKDIRTLAAIAVRGFAEDPDRYLKGGAAARLLSRSNKIQAPGTRYRGGGEQADVEAIQRRDAARVDDLYQLLTTRREPAISVVTVTEEVPVRSVVLP